MVQIRCTSLVAQLILRWDTCVHNLPRVQCKRGDLDIAWGRRSKFTVLREPPLRLPGNPRRHVSQGPTRHVQEFVRFGAFRWWQSAVDLTACPMFYRRSVIKAPELQTRLSANGQCR